MGALTGEISREIKSVYEDADGAEITLGDFGASGWPCFF
jgi:hypothetical protein